MKSETICETVELFKEIINSSRYSKSNYLKKHLKCFKSISQFLKSINNNKKSRKAAAIVLEKAKLEFLSHETEEKQQQKACEQLNFSQWSHHLNYFLALR